MWEALPGEGCEVLLRKSGNVIGVADRSEIWCKYSYMSQNCAE